MRKVLILVGLTLLAVAVVLTVLFVQRQQELRLRAAPATTLSIQPASITKAGGEEFTVEVAINTGANTVSAAELIITFDGTKLQGLSVEKGTFLPVELLPGTVSGSQATITLGSQPTNPKQGSGVLAKLRFKVTAASGSSAIRFGSGTQVAGIGEQGNVLISTTPGNVTVAGTGGAPTPTPTTPATTPTPTSALTTPTPTPGSGGSGGLNLEVVSPADGATVTTATPTITGIAAAGSTVTVVIYSDPITGVVTADTEGNWSFTVPQPLADGSHQINVTEQRLDGTTRTTTSSFFVQTSEVPVSGSTDLVYLLLAVGSAFVTLGWVLLRVSAVGN